MTWREVLIRDAVIRVTKKEWPCHYEMYGLKCAVNQLHRWLLKPYLKHAVRERMLRSIQIEYLILAIRHAPQEIKE